MKFKLIKEARVIAETIEFQFEFENVKYIGRIHDDGEGNKHWLFDEEYNAIDDGPVYDEFINTFFDLWKISRENEVLDTEEDF
jgi:hypothetical protein